MLSIDALKKKVANLPRAVTDDVHEIISHPQFLAGLLAGPEGPFLIAEAHRSGALGNALNQAGLGHVANLLGGGKGNVGRHPTPGQFPVNTRDPNKSYCSTIAGGKPFPLAGKIIISAGAQTQGTDLGDFHSTTANPTIITTSDLIPGNVTVKSCRLTIGVKMITTLGAETQGLLENLWIIERVNGTEIARWSPADLGCTIDHSGVLGTAFGVSNQIEIAGKWQEWDRQYDPNVPYALAVQMGRTTTTVQDLEIAFVEAGQRP